jgi:two-component system, response regulator, stage 0 sporulation protein F
MAEKILVVDDEENMLRLFKRALGREGYQVVCAASGQAALEMASRDTFSLAIVDIELPGMDGIGLMKRLRALNQRLPIVVVTAQRNPETEQRAKDSGCTAFFPKPIDIKRFKKIIRSLIAD